MTTPNYDVVVVGAGVVGLATAVQLLRKRPELRIAILEKESRVAAHQSSHNSGVIHSGLYYKPGSAKARTCLAGYRQLLEFCQQEGVPHEVCGKVVVATSERERQQLGVLQRRGQENGLQGLERWSGEQLREREPHCAGVEALFVPQTGIVDYGQVALAYARKLEKAGVALKLGNRVRQIRRRVDEGGVEVISDHGPTLLARVAIACAGLQSDRLATTSGLSLDIRILPFRGEYYKLKADATHLVKHLIYPVPDPAFPFLGVHFTRMVGGGVECGPNAVLALAREQYQKLAIDPADAFDALAWPGLQKLAQRYWQQGLAEVWRSWWKPAFVAALQRLVPAVTSADLEVGGAGIRAQACDRQGQLVDDFVIASDGPVLHVGNAPSPAATASLGIGQELASITLQRLEL
jgi:L-2-hydroxyglutarate oxidase